MANILIVAIDHHTAHYWMREMRISAESAKVVTKLKDIYGYKNVSIAYVGEYWRLKDHKLIKDYAMQHGLREIEV